MLWFIALSVAVACYCLLERLLSLPHDAREPPLIPQSVPILGHALGILRHGSRYYTKISNKYPNLPIYTLRVPRSKVYIVTSPALVAAIDRQTKIISFSPYIVLFVKQILQPTEKTLQTFSEDIEGTNGSHGAWQESLKAMHNSLAPGVYLKDMTQAALESVTRHLDGVVRDKTRIGLFACVRAFLTRASTDAIYGAEKNPFQDPETQDAFWIIDKDLVYLGLNILPPLLARRANQARNRIFESFHDYYASNGQVHASRVIKARYEAYRKYDISQSDIEHFDLSVCYALLANTIPAAAWALYHIFSSQSMLNELRQIISSYVQTTQDPATGHVFHNLNIASMVTNSPFLVAFIHEVLRTHSTNASGRVVLRDTVIENNNHRYLLRKGSTLLAPSAELHRNTEAWGPSPTTFHPDRFLRQKSRHPTSAYRAFGGGSSVCPGRQFAINEIAIILVVMVCRFDLTPAGVGGGWEVPECRPHVTTSILTPVKDFEVDVVERVVGSKEWRFEWDKEEGETAS